MPATPRTRLTYANVVSTGCLFILLGGGAYAATTLSGDSVGSRQIKKNAVRSAEVRDASLKARDFRPGQLPAGAPGPAGPAGETGPSGPPGTVRAYGLVSSVGALDPERSSNLTVTKISGQAGAYCVRPTAGSGIDPQRVRPVVSADLSSGAGSVKLAQVSSTTYYEPQCPAAAGWEIYTQHQLGTNAFAASDAGFSILVP
jgi:hypothetical protein